MIQCKKEYLIEEKNINSLVTQAKKVLNHRKMLYNRYVGKKRTEVDVPLEFYSTNIVSGYFGGKAPEYSIKQENNKKKIEIIKNFFNKVIGKNTNVEEFQLLIDYIRDYNDDSSFFYDLVKDYFMTGACYGLTYETEDNEIVYTHISSLQCVAIYDYSAPLQKIGLLRVWQELDNDGFNCNMVEIITNDSKFYYKNSKLQPNEYKLEKDMSEEIAWKLTPAFAVENVDNLAIFEPVISLIDSYQQIIENNRNIFQYNDDAKLMITGYRPANEMFIQDPDNPENNIINPERIKEDEIYLKSKVFYTDDTTGKIEWIIKNINDTASENHKKTLMELILMTICVPNVTDTGFTNADNSSALEKKFFPLEQAIIQADKQFKKELLAMWENIVDRINLKKSTHFDFRDIQVNLKRNMPTEKQEVVNMALQLRQLLSDETCISMLPFDIDVTSEKQKKEQETEDNIMNNFNKIINQNGNQNNDKELNKE